MIGAANAKRVASWFLWHTGWLLAAKQNVSCTLMQLGVVSARRADLPEGGDGALRVAPVAEEGNGDGTAAETSARRADLHRSKGARSGRKVGRVFDPTGS